MKKTFRSSVSRSLLVISVVTGSFLTAFQETQQDGGISPWVWLLLIAIALIVVWMIIRAARQSPSTPPRTEPDGMRTSSTVSTGPGSVQTFTTPDDLTVIEGIGPKIAGILQSAGITTFSQLAAADIDQIREILDKGGIRLVDPRSWTEQARLAAAGDETGLSALQDDLKGGRQV